MYDPFGRRIAKQRLVADGVTVAEEVCFVWDSFVLAEQVTRIGDEAPRCTLWDWEHDRFSPVAQVDRIAAKDRLQEWVDEQFYAIRTDVVGTLAELVDDTSAVAWHARTTVWGSSLDAGPAPGEAYCPLRFPGQFHAPPETGLNYNYQRHYDPDTGIQGSTPHSTRSAWRRAPTRSYVSNPFSAAEAVSHAMNAGVDPRGGVMASVETRPPGNPKLGGIKPPWPSCQHVLDQFGNAAVT